MEDTQVRRRGRRRSQPTGQMPDDVTPGEASSNPQQSSPCSRFEVCADGRCPIEDTLNIIGGRWTILILWWLQEGELRFGELRRYIPSVSPKMLTQQLRQLEEQGLVRREIFAQVPPKVVYSMTERGRSLRPVLKSLYDWSVANAADHSSSPSQPGGG